MSSADSIPLLPNQAWFLEEKRPSMFTPGQFSIGQMYSMPVWARPEDVRSAVESVLRTNEQLRARFIQMSGEWTQHIADASTPAPFITVPLLNIPPEERESFIDRVAEAARLLLNIEAGALIHFVHFDLGPGERSRLLILAHHLVIDLYSFRIVETDLIQALRDIHAGRTPQLAPRAGLAECADAIVDFILAESPFALDGWEEQASVACGTLVEPTDGERTGLGQWRETVREVGNSLSHAATFPSEPGGNSASMEHIAMAAALDAVTGAVGAPTWVKVMHNGRSLRRVHSGDGRVLPTGSLRTVGWFATSGLHLFYPRGTRTMHDYLNDEVLRLATSPNQGVEAAIARWSMPAENRPASVIEIWSRTSVLFNYWPMSQVKHSAEVEPQKGDRLAPYLDPLEKNIDLHVTVGLNGGDASIHLGTNPHLVPSQVTERIADGFVIALGEMSSKVDTDA